QNEHTSATDTGTEREASREWSSLHLLSYLLPAVDNDLSIWIRLSVLADTKDELQKVRVVVGHALVGPGQILQVGNQVRFIGLHGHEERIDQSHIQGVASTLTSMSTMRKVRSRKATSS